MACEVVTIRILIDELVFKKNIIINEWSCKNVTRLPCSESFVFSDPELGSHKEHLASRDEKFTEAIRKHTLLYKKMKELDITDEIDKTMMLQLSPDYDYLQSSSLPTLLHLKIIKYNKDFPRSGVHNFFWITPCQVLPRLFLTPPAKVVPWHTMTSWYRDTPCQADSLIPCAKLVPWRPIPSWFPDFCVKAISQHHTHADSTTSCVTFAPWCHVPSDCTSLHSRLILSLSRADSMSLNDCSNLLSTIPVVPVDGFSSGLLERQASPVLSAFWRCFQCHFRHGTLRSGDERDRISTNVAPSIDGWAAEKMVATHRIVPDVWVLLTDGAWPR